MAQNFYHLYVFLAMHHIYLHRNLLHISICTHFICISILQLNIFSFMEIGKFDQLYRHMKLIACANSLNREIKGLSLFCHEYFIQIQLCLINIFPFIWFCSQGKMFLPNFLAAAGEVRKSDIYLFSYNAVFFAHKIMIL